MSISVAIVGSGPSGFYTADALSRTKGAFTVDMIDRLPAPFGLVRYGVAPDHESTRRVARNFDKLAREGALRYFGNVEIGRDLALDELRGLYDAVVLAVGAPHDRPLGVPGSDKKGVHGSAAFVGWYNGHPDFRALDPDLKVKTAVVVGVGNVALDVARLLVTPRDILEKTDMPDYALKAFAENTVTDVYMFGRRGPVEAAFTIGELREMGETPGASPVVDANDLPAAEAIPEALRKAKARNIEMMRGFAAKPADRPKRVHFRFHAAPKEVLGGQRVAGIRMEKTRVERGQAVGTGETFEVECGLVVAAIGYRAQVLAGAPFDDRKGIFANTGGRIAPGLYAAGWAMRGPSGVIGSNKADGQQAAANIAADFAGGGAKPGRAALEKLLAARQVRATDWNDWLKLDAAEIARARPGAPRGRFTSVEEMLGFLKQAER